MSARRHCRGRARRGPVDRVVGVFAWRIGEVVRRQVRQQRLERDHGVVLVGHHQGRNAALAFVHGRAPEPVALDGHARERDHDVGSGHVRERVGGHDHVVGDAQQQRGPRHRRAHQEEHDRHDARRVAQCLGDAAPRVQGGDAVGDVGTRAGDATDDRHAQLDREVHGPLDGLTLAGADGPAVLPAVEAEPGDHPAVDLAEGRLHRGAAVPEHGQRHTGCRHVSPATRPAVSRRRGRPTRG
jgi:hypothetical protein